MGEIGGQGGSQVRGDQQLLQLLEQRVVDGSIGLQHGAEPAGEVLLRAPEPLAEALAQPGEELHRMSGGRTNRVTTAPLAPSRGIGRPLSSRLTPPALPMVRTKGPLDTHSRTSLAGIISSLVRPSSVRTRIQVVSVVRATSRYGETTLSRVVEGGAGTGAGTLGGISIGAAA